MKYKISADDRCNGSTQRIPRLCEVKTARCGLRFTEKCYIRISCYLQQSKSDSENKEESEKKAIYFDIRRRIKSGTSSGRDQKTEDNTVLISHFAHGISPENRNNEVNDRSDKICAEKSELYKHRLVAVKLEHFSQERNKNVVEHRNESPHKKKRRKNYERSCIFWRFVVHYSPFIFSIIISFILP